MRQPKGHLVRTAEDQLLICRTMGHSWDFFNPIDKPRPDFGWRLSLRCTRCATERHDVIDTKGFVASRRYEYPDAYIDLGKGFRELELGREEFRRELAYRRYGRPVGAHLAAVG